MDAVIVVFLLGPLCAVIGAYLGDRKGLGVLGGVLGFFLGPVGIAVVLAMKGSRYPCPHCRERIHRDATACPHCTRTIDEDE